MLNLINDISTLTDVSESTLKKFTSVSNYCIGHAIHEALCSKEDIVEIDLGIGSLYIKICDDDLRYRFIPSKELEKMLVQTVKTNNSPLMLKLDKNLQEKIDRTYKELI